MVDYLVQIPERWARWRDTNYWVSDEGRIKHIYPNGKVVFMKGYRDNGVVKVHLGTSKYTFQNVVWEAWKGTIPDGYVIVHKNECITMNDLYNLEMITRREHARRQKLKTGYWVRDMQTNKTYKSLRECEKAVHKNRKDITKDCNGQQRRFRWINGRGGRNETDTD